MISKIFLAAAALGVLLLLLWLGPQLLHRGIQVSPLPPGIRASELTYAKAGPFTVRERDLTLGEGSNALPISVWVPVAPASTVTSQAPFPLVIFSPGFAGRGKDQEVDLIPIASHGFVVISWDPRGESQSAFWAGAATRPLDLRRIIDGVDGLTAPAGPLAGLIDTHRIAVAGHSSGGWTALLGGGAEMDLGLCLKEPERIAKLPASNCPQFLPHQGDIANLLNLRVIPTKLWPPFDEPHVMAVMAASPDGDIWGVNYEGLAVMRTPTLILAGENDPVNLPELCAYPIYQHLGSPNKGLAVFEQADHGLSWETYADAIKHIQIAFLLAHLKDDPVARRVLAPENLHIPGVKYQTTGFGTGRPR